MSGGSYDYMFYNVMDTYAGRMFDEELNELIEDLSKVFHDLEWWQSGDYSESTYRKSVQEFKEKWLGRTEEKQYEFYKDKLLEKAENLANEMFGKNVYEEQD